MKYNLINENYKNNYGENLIRGRGVEDIKLFLEPDNSCLLHPLLLNNIEEAAQRYLDILLNNKTPSIFLVVDSDIDGFTSAAIFYKYTKDICPKAEIEWRLHEGKQHGLEDHINYIIDSNKEYHLVVCPDSSSNDYKQHELLKERGIPVLVLDHHIVETDCPMSDNAYIVNNQLSKEYKNKQLTGAGIVFQFCRYLDFYLNKTLSSKYIDLAALGIIGDMGSVIELENRYIIKEGLSNVKNEFFWELMRKQGYSITGKMNPSDCDILKKMTPITTAFYIVPLVNAMIRVGTMPEKERAFLAFIDGKQEVPSSKRGAKGTYEQVCIESARECYNARNRQNKKKEEVVESLKDRILKEDLLENKILFIRLEEEDDFPSELNGLISMQLSAKYKKPTIVARLNEEGYIRGSMRGLSNSPLTDFKEFLMNSGYFEYVMGHPNAAGCSIKNQDLRAFHEYANKELADMNFGENVYDVNFVRFANDSDIVDIIYDLNNYSTVWGQCNNEPSIFIHEIHLTTKDIQVIGSKADTVRFVKNGICYLQFHAKKLIEDLARFDEFTISVVGRTNVNEWCGNYTPQIFIDDYEIKEYNVTSF